MTASTHPWQRPPGISGSVDPDAADFGYAIEELRETCGWTRAEVGNRAQSMAYSTVAGIENGHRPPSKRTMGPLAQGLLVAREDLEELWRLFQLRARAEVIDPVWHRLLEQAQAHAQAQFDEPSDPADQADRAFDGPSPFRSDAIVAAPRQAPLPPIGRSDGFEPEILGLRAELDRFDAGAELDRLDVDDEFRESLRDRRSNRRSQAIDRLMDLASGLPDAGLDTAVAVLEALAAKARADGTLRD
jgi:transcriptional regulator with XRE-family HTH domain